MLELFCDGLCTLKMLELGPLVIFNYVGPPWVKINNT